MIRPLASLLHRSGIVSYLRRTWRADDDELRRRLQGEAARRVREATTPLDATISELRRGQRELRQEIKLLRAVLAANGERALERHPGALDFDAVARHTDAAIRSAPLVPAPMPHLLIDNVLPEATYRALIEATPPDECFHDRDRVKQNFRPAHERIVPDFTRAMWTFLEDQVVARVMTPALISRFQPHIEQIYSDRYGERAPEAAALPHHATAGRLMLRRPGYHLEPHLDPRRVIVTCLLYFARPGDDASFGTQLFSVGGLSQVVQSKTFYPRQAGYECQLARTIPFAANTAVAFLNAGAAAHGATIPDSAPADTRRYAYQFYVSPDPQALAAVTGDATDGDQ